MHTDNNSNANSQSFVYVKPLSRVVTNYPTLESV